KGRMETDGVGLPQQIFQLDPGEAGPVRFFAMVRVVGDDAHAEGVGDGADLAADAAESDDAHNLSSELDQGRFPEAPVGAAGPLAGADGVGMQLDILAELEEEGEDELRHRSSAVGGDVRDGDAALFRGLDIDDVVAGGEDADVAELWELGEDIAGKRRLVGE